MRLGVPDVDGEQHRRPLCSDALDGGERAQAVRPARLAPVRRRRSGARAEAHRVPPRRPAADRARCSRARCSTAARPCPACGSARERLVGSRPIMRRLDELAPEPPLLPPTGRSGARARARGRALGRRGPAGGAAAADRRRLPARPRVDRELRRRREAAAAALAAAPGAAADGARDGAQEPGAATRPRAPTCWRCRASSSASTAGSREGLLGGEQPNAADLQIGSTIRLLQSIGDVAPLIEGRACERLARLLPADGRRRAGRRAAGRVARGRRRRSAAGRRRARGSLRSAALSGAASAAG